MGGLLQSIKNHGAIIFVPVWTGLLVLPFVGMGKALQLAVVALATMFLGGFWRTDAVTVFRKKVSDIHSRVNAFFSPVSKRLNSTAFLVMVVVFMLILPIFLNDYYRDIMVLTGMYIVLALGLNVVVGQAGLLNLGYVAFYATGAYTYAILSTTAGLAFWPGLAVGASTSALFSVVLGLPTLRLRGDYFAIVTLGLGEITRIVLNNWDSLTGGPNGISKITRPSILGYELHTALDFYYLILAIVVLAVFTVNRLISSRIGRAWIAIREDETAAEAMGINTFRLKLLAFVIGSAWAGTVGVFFAAKMAFVSPESFTFFESVMILCMVVLGGMGSIPGTILGAFLLITLPEIFREFQDYRMLAFGAALVAMMVFRPQGLLGTAKSTAR